MEARLQRRLQRYGWDLAAALYEPLWRSQLACAQTEVIARAAPAPRERVLDVACGTGLVAFDVAQAVGPGGAVLGIDLSAQMIAAAQRRALELNASNVTFFRMDAEMLDLPNDSFDVALCALGLMYMPSPERALHEMRRVLRPGGRLTLAVWGARSHCGWSALFPIVDAEVTSEVCPLFFRLGEQDALVRLCADAHFESIELHRITAILTYTDADAAFSAAFVGGPVALAWSRFSDEVRARVRSSYVNSIEAWRYGHEYRIPGEFVIVAAVAPIKSSPRRVSNRRARPAASRSALFQGNKLSAGDA